MNRDLKIGDKVMLSADSRWNNGTVSNPLNTLGEVNEVGIGSLGILVVWESGIQNGYDPIDLILQQPETTQTEPIDLLAIEIGSKWVSLVDTEYIAKGSVVVRIEAPVDDYLSVAFYPDGGHIGNYYYLAADEITPYIEQPTITTTETRPEAIAPLLWGNYKDKLNEEALAALKHVILDVDKHEEIVFEDHNKLVSAFDWACTEQGRDFWDDVDEGEYDKVETNMKYKYDYTIDVNAKGERRYTSDSFEQGSEYDAVYDPKYTHGIEAFDNYGDALFLSWGNLETLTAHNGAELPQGWLEELAERAVQKVEMILTEPIKSAIPPSAMDIQISGNHYKTCGIQPVEYIHANALDYFQGNVVKYLTRHKSKNGAEDIKKAIHYLQLILQLQYGE